MARPSELDAENRSGKTVSTAATAYFRTGYPTDVGGGEFEYAAEVAGLGGIDFLAEDWEKSEQVQTPSAFFAVRFCQIPGYGPGKFDYS